MENKKQGENGKAKGRQKNKEEQNNEQNSQEKMLETKKTRTRTTTTIHKNTKAQLVTKKNTNNDINDTKKQHLLVSHGDTLEHHNIVRLGSEFFSGDQGKLQK